MKGLGGFTGASVIQISASIHGGFGAFNRGATISGWSLGVATRSRGGVGGSGSLGGLSIQNFGGEDIGQGTAAVLGATPAAGIITVSGLDFGPSGVALTSCGAD